MSKAKSTKSQACIVVLGMHRSGTSALSGTLSKMGYGLPVTLAPADHNNQNGYFESKALWAVNDDLLAEIGSGWDDWSAIDLTTLPGDLYQRSMKRAVALIHSEYGQHDGPILMKDPRMCRTMPLWIEAITQAGYRPFVVQTHRRPGEVAASLHRRDGYDPAYGLLMWLAHVLEAEKATRDLPRCFTSFNLLMQDWRDVIETLHQRLDLRAPRSQTEAATEVEAFLNIGLRNFSDTTDAAPLDAWWQQCFDILERWARTGETPKDHAALDDLRAELGGMNPQMAALIRPGQRARIEQSAENNSLLSLRTDDDARASELEGLTTALAERDDTLQKQAKTLKIWGLENDSLRAQVSTKKRLEELLHADVRSRDKTIEKMSREQNNLRAEVSHLTSAGKDLRAVIADKEMNIARLLDIIRERGEALKQRDSKLAELSAEREASNAEMQALHIDAAQRKEALHAFQTEATRHQETLNKLQSEKTTLAQRAIEAEERNRGLMQSTSWRFTAPLRSILLFVRGRLS